MTLRYQGRHRSQYVTGATLRLRSMGCGPTSLANALRCATGGAIDLTGDQVLAKVAPTEEQISGGGWTLGDVQLAASRIPGAPPFAVRRGRWSEVTSALAAGLGVVLQGDSDQFTGGCSGAFLGDHCIFVHPDTVSGRQSTGDPICPDWRTETLAVLQAYAEKLSGLDVRFGTFTTPIPPADTTPPESSTGDPDMATVTPALIACWYRGGEIVGWNPEKLWTPAAAFVANDGEEGRISGFFDISQTGDPEPAPHGRFARVAAGPLAGLYVDAADVSLAPPQASAPGADCTAAIAADRAKARIVWE